MQGYIMAETRFVVLVAVGTCCIPSGALGQSALLTPDWGADATSRYLQSRSDPTDRAAPMNTPANAATRSSRTFSLPVLGVQQGFQNQTPVPEIRDRSIGETIIPAAATWWPACATAAPTMTIADDASGTWYTANYDFGCINVTITGERNSTTNVPPGLIDDLAERAGDSRSATDENNDPNATFMRTHEIKRFNIPYTVSIECTPDSLSFCKDETAQKIFLSRLSIIDGAPNQ